MSIVVTTRARCPACKREQDAELVQSINARTDADAKERLLAGQLNLLVCRCGHRTHLAATVLFHDPDAGYFCQVAPGGEEAIAEAVATFRSSGTTGTLRVVPSLNALVEKVKILDAGFEDWAIEMTKVLLLASLGDGELDRVLLFQRVDAAEGLISWVLFGEAGGDPQIVASPLPAYANLAAQPKSAPDPDELRIDRAWAIEAVRQMIARGN